MAFITYTNIGISAIAACVPSKVVTNHSLKDLVSSEELDKTINTIGIKEKRFADDNVCSSDLCYKAAEKLLNDNNIDKATIDVLIFLSQTPDYKIPATSPILQHRLGLNQSTACFDISIGCSGYVYGLSTAYAYAANPGINRVLLLIGETFSKITSQKDKVNAPLYGDGGTATLIEKGDYSPTYFDLYSDGNGYESVIIPAGGYRNPTNADNIVEKIVEEGNIRSDHQIFMDGMDIFNFAMKVVPKGVKEILQKISLQLSDIDFLIFHQSNKFMTDFFVKRLKFDSTKVPYCIDRYGNTSSTSIGLTIASELGNELLQSKKIMMCGFGAGLSWGTAYIEFRNCKNSGVIEY